MFKYLKKRLALFFICLIVSATFFSATKSVEAKKDKKEEAWLNAYLACLVDEDTHSYKFQVIYSGVCVEGTSFFLSEDDLEPVDGRLSLYKLTNDIYKHLVYLDPATGKFEVQDLFDQDSLDYVDGKNNYPLTFPGLKTVDATADDINRAYDVMDAIGEDFMDALLFINDGKAYDNTDALIQTAYFLCTSGMSGSTIVNQYGKAYSITYNTAPVNGTNGYLYACDIVSEDGVKQSFNYKIKKGYNGCVKGEVMENGKVNTLAADNKVSSVSYINDTEYITWEYFFLEAGIFYSDGVTYANYADLYSVTDLENSMLDLTRNLLGGIRNILQLYSMEDLIFNLGVRSSSAFSYGVYNHNWDFNINAFYLILTGISVVAVFVSTVLLIQKKQLSTINPNVRVSLMEGFQNILLCVFFMAISRVLIMFFMLLNQEFVGIFATVVDGKSLKGNNAYSVLAAIILQFAFLVIEIYVNYIYIMRGLMVPALIIVSSPSVLAFTFGQKGQMITKAWIRELLSLIFIQSIHALCYGFILMSSTGLRGIESIIICTSIIPLTSLFKNIFGVGADGLIRAASGATVAASTAGTAAIGGAAGVVSAVTPAPVGMVANMASGAFTAGVGSGLSLTDDPIATLNGTRMMHQGLSVNGAKLKNDIRESGEFFKDAYSGVKKAAGRISNTFKANTEKTNSVISQNSNMNFASGGDSALNNSPSLNNETKEPLKLADVNNKYSVPSHIADMPAEKKKSFIVSNTSNYDMLNNLQKRVASGENLSMNDVRQLDKNLSLSEISVKYGIDIGRLISANKGVGFSASESQDIIDTERFFLSEREKLQTV